MLFDICPPDVKLEILKQSKNRLFFKYAYLMETDTDIDFEEVIKIGNKQFKGRFEKLFKDYKTNQNEKEEDKRWNKWNKSNQR